MKAQISIIILSTLLAGCATTEQKDHNPHWGYVVEEGPEFWGELHTQNAICSTGVNQSPVNLSGFIESDLEPLGLSYKSGGNEVINNGHTIQVNYQPGSYLAINGGRYELKQFHFHSPSENHISGQSYPMEVHLVHASKEGNLAVVGVMFEEGQENKALSSIWAKMPINAGENNVLHSVISADDLLPANQDYYRFNGSLTTPPCSEGVLWLVMKESITVSKAQIEKFNQVMKHPTNRPVQAINARPILK